MSGLGGIYSGKRVLVTGHTGFKGTWLSLMLLPLGAEVIGFSIDVPTEPSLFNLLGLSNSLNDGRGDIRDCSALDRAVETARPDFIFHFAGQSIVSRAYADPAGTFATNATGTLNLLEAVRKANRPVTVVLGTSDKCYGTDPNPEPFVESDPLAATDPYGASKAAAELIARSWRRSYFDGPDAAIRVATARVGNVIGGGDWGEGRIVPHIAARLSAGQPVDLHSPNAVRPWQHVQDALAGYLTLGAVLSSHTDPATLPTAWNLGPNADADHDVAALANSFIRHWGGGSWERSNITPDFPEASVLRIASDRARSELGWSPLWDFDRSVEATAHWYRLWARNPAEAADLTIEQLAQYRSQLSNL